MNFWTSFGYFSEEENKCVLREIATVLKSEGLFVLDIANPVWLLRNFQEKDWDQDETYLSLEERAVDWKSKRWKSRWIVVNKQTKEIDEIAFDHRLYDLQELREMLDRAGFGGYSDIRIIQERKLRRSHVQQNHPPEQKEVNALVRCTLNEARSARLCHRFFSNSVNLLPRNASPTHFSALSPETHPQTC